MSGFVLSQLLLFVLSVSASDEYYSAEIAARIKRGNHRAFKTFFDAHHKALFNFLAAKGIARETVADLIKKAFIYIGENRQKIDPEKSLRAYLFRIGYTRMLNHIRDNKKFDLLGNLHLTGSPQNPEEHVQTQQLQTAIEDAIAAMPEKRGMVFEMCFIKEFTYRETADALDVSKKTVENHMGLAFKDIRKALKTFNPAHSQPNPKSKISLGGTTDPRVYILQRAK